jgi:hypothetical protein
MEHELWSLIFANPGLRGVGLHTVGVLTPKPELATAEDLANDQRQFLGGLKTAAATARLAEPEYMILGMSGRVGTTAATAGHPD